MASERSTIRLLQSVGLTASGMLAGYSLAFTTILVPNLLSSPSPLIASQFVPAYARGKYTVPPATVFCAGIYSFLAYSAHTNGYHRHITYSYLASAVAAISIIPYTMVVMMPTIKKLSKKEEESRGLIAEGKVSGLVESGDETAHALVDYWGLLNLVRTALFVGSTFLGVTTSLMWQV